MAAQLRHHAGRLGALPESPQAWIVGQVSPAARDSFEWFSADAPLFISKLAELRDYGRGIWELHQDAMRSSRDRSLRILTYSRRYTALESFAAQGILEGSDRVGRCRASSIISRCSSQRFDGKLSH